MDSLRSLSSLQNGGDLLQVKSKYLAEFRRFSIHTASDTFKSLLDHIENLHQLNNIETVVTYTDPVHGDLLPINNDENFAKAKQTCSTGLLRIYVHKKDNYVVNNGFGNSTINRRKGKKKPLISLPEDFRPVSAIIDVDILPESLRRVRLHNHGANKPLGFFIRDGVSLHMSEEGVEKIPGIFISRLQQNGLAEMTGLLAVNDEVIEVNGIEVAGKSLDQVTDMMIANSSNLIITVKPASMRNLADTTRSKVKERSHLPNRYQFQNGSDDENIDEDDVIKDISSGLEEQASLYASITSDGSSRPEPLRRSSEVLSFSSKSSSSSSIKRTDPRRSRKSGKNFGSVNGNGVVNL